jgi:hypothetical protein
MIVSVTNRQPWMNRWTLVRCLTTVLVFFVAQPATGETSSTWGAAGEAFDDRGRLMDWSYAGYGYGEVPRPSAEATVLVTDYGAVPDDAGDDTAAIQQAIVAAAAGGVVSIPAGTFVVTDKLILTEGVVLRGAGRDATILDIPVSLTDVYGNPGPIRNNPSHHKHGADPAEAGPI